MMKHASVLFLLQATASAQLLRVGRHKIVATKRAAKSVVDPAAEVYDPYLGLTHAAKEALAAVLSREMDMSMPGSADDDADCASDADCFEGRYCERAPGDCDGVGKCAFVPEVCTLELDEVCGCNGETYGNPCQARADGAGVASEGACDDHDSHDHDSHDHDSPDDDGDDHDSHDHDSPDDDDDDHDSHDHDSHDHDSHDDLSRVVLLYGEPTPRHHAGQPDSNRTEAVAKMIAAEAGVEATFFEKPYDNYDFDAYDAIIVGAPTYNTGAVDYRSTTDWDDWLYDELPNIDVRGKHVAIFGTGKGWYPKFNDDGSLKSCCSGYGDNFGDAMGELYDRFAEAGARMFGFTPENHDFENGGYNFTHSKFIRNGMFMGQMFDQKSQEELSPGRAVDWVEQLRNEGFF